MNEEKAFYVDTPWTWRERLRFTLFPSEPCPLPSAPAEWADVVVVTTTVQFSMLDRLRILLSGTVHVQTRTVTEHVVGGTQTASIAYPIWQGK